MSIDKVNEEDLLAEIRSVFEANGALETEVAIRVIGQGLGFTRVSAKTQDVIRKTLSTAVRRGIILGDHGTYRMDCRSIENYFNEYLDKYLCAAMGRAWQEEDEAIRSTARYLGYKRTGQVIRETLKKTIRRCVRSGTVERDGSMVRKT